MTSLVLRDLGVSVPDPRRESGALEVDVGVVGQALGVEGGFEVFEREGEVEDLVVWGV